MDRKTVENNFKYHSATPSKAALFDAIREAGRTMAVLILEDCPLSREQHLAMTNLEQAVFWANAAIARNE